MVATPNNPPPPPPARRKAVMVVLMMAAAVVELSVGLAISCYILSNSLATVVTMTAVYNKTKKGSSIQMMKMIILSTTNSIIPVTATVVVIVPLHLHHVNATTANVKNYPVVLTPITSDNNAEVKRKGSHHQHHQRQRQNHHLNLETTTAAASNKMLHKKLHGRRRQQSYITIMIQTTAVPITIFLAVSAD